MIQRPVELIDGVGSEGIAYFRPIEGNPDCPDTIGAVVSDVGEVETGDFRPGIRIEDLGYRCIGHESPRSGADGRVDTVVTHMQDDIAKDLLATAAATWPDSVALRWRDGAWTYRELDYAASEIAGRVPAGERVAFRAEMSPATVAAVWGIPRGGGIAVPIDPGLGASDAAELAGTFGATLGWPRDHERIRAEREAHPNASAFVIATSGSSGTPRGVIVTFGNIVAAAFASQLHLGSRAGDVWLLAMPLHHVAGLAILWRAAHDGAAVRLQESFDATGFAAALAEDVCWASVVPTMLRRLLAAPMHAPMLRGLLVGGAHTPEVLLEEAVERKIPALATYGMTETTSQACTVVPGQEPASLGTVGFPLPGVAISIDAAEGRAGLIRVDGATVSPGYIDEMPRQGPLITNDIGYFDAAGRLVVVGRADDVIISGGENVQPEMVERALCAIDGVAEAVVFGVEDPEWGQLVAAVVAADGLSANEVLSRLEGLPRHAVPKRITVMKELPLLSNGKVDRERAKLLF